MDSSGNPNTRDFTVAIVGGGVCGLALAIALAKKGVPAQLFEAAPKFEQTGAGLGLGPNSTKVLDSLGLLRGILEKVGESEANFESFQFLSGSEGHESIYNYAETSKTQGIGLHRAVFLEALLPLVDMNNAHFNKRCTSIAAAPDDSGRSIIHFTDGTTYEADVIIGADGIKSAIRTAVVGDAIKRVAFSNTECYRALVPLSDLQAAGVREDLLRGAHILLGNGRHIVLYPVRVDNTTLINFVGFVANHDIPIGSVTLPADQPTVASATRDDVLAVYNGWGSDAVTLIKCLPEVVSKWSIHMVDPPLDTYAKGHIALVGDAAHAMLPHLGAGAGQGIEDIFVLSELLGHPNTTKHNMEAVLQAYDRVRRPHSQMVVRRSTETGILYESHGKPGVTVEDTRENLKERWVPIWGHDMVPDVNAAVNWLEDMSVFSKMSRSKF